MERHSQHLHGATRFGIFFCHWKANKTIWLSYLWAIAPKWQQAKTVSCDSSFWHLLLFLQQEVKNSLSTTEQVPLRWFTWHWAELTALILYPAMQLKLLTMCCWLQTHSLASHALKKGLAMQRQQCCCACQDLHWVHFISHYLIYPLDDGLLQNP